MLLYASLALAGGITCCCPAALHALACWDAITCCCLIDVAVYQALQALFWLMS